MLKEVRHLSFSLREAQTENGIRLMTGYAIKWDTESEDLGGFVEIIQRGALSQADVDKWDIRALFDHDTSKVLGRTAAGTLKLTVDETGLAFEIAPPDFPWVRELQESISRGDISQMSFRMRSVEDKWREREKQVPLRVITKLKIDEISIVSIPAYTDTLVALRQIDQTKDVDEQIDAIIQNSDLSQREKSLVADIRSIEALIQRLRTIQPESGVQKETDQAGNTEPEPAQAKPEGESSGELELLKLTLNILELE